MFITAAEAENYIHNLKVFGEKPGLRRIRRLLQLCGDPQRGLRFVHVAGTNGKGTTTSLCAAACRAAGHKTGLFISPYVLCFRERMQIDGEMISESDLALYTARMAVFAEQMRREGEPPAEFEFVTAVAMLWFCEQRCDVVCLEVGLGGRFDATNAIDSPLVAVITAIGLDHMAILGDTVEQIAAEKCGILKPPAPAVVYPLQPGGVMGVVQTCAAAVGAPVVTPDLGQLRVRHSDLFGSDFTYKGLACRVNLGGRHQIYNAVTAIEALRQLRQQGLSLPDSAIREGFAALRFPARLEVLHEHPLVILDGAHNESGAVALAAAIAELPHRPLIGIAGVMRDKAAGEVLGAMGPLCRKIYCTAPGVPRATSPEELAAAANTHTAQAIAVNSPPEALAAAVADAGVEGAVVIFGSLYLASEMRPIALALDRPSP